MLRIRALIGLGIVSLVLSVQVLAQGAVASAPSGFYRIQLLGDSDTFVSLPFLRPAEGWGLVGSVADNVVTIGGSPGWTADHFVRAGVQTNTYFMLVCSGSLEGHYWGITDNAANTLSLDLNEGTLAGLAAGDRIEVIPYWTLGTVFPGGQSVHESPNDFTRRTEILIPNYGGVGINLSTANTYYFISGHWMLYPPSVAKDDEPLLPDGYFIVRHNVSTPTELTVRGSVAMTKWTIPLVVQPSTKQDNMLAIIRPNATSLNESGLIASGAFAGSPNDFARTDELLMFDNTTPGKNKSASDTYYYLSDPGAWRRYGSAADVGAEKIFTPGAGFIIRKNAGSTGVKWTNPGY